VLGVFGEGLNSEVDQISKVNELVVSIEVRLVFNELVNKMVSVVLVVVAIKFV
jgi:hypothetical protein